MKDLKKMIRDRKLGELLADIKAPGSNPGGGAIVLLVGQMAINLGLMMDKKDFLEKEIIARDKRESLQKISVDLEKLIEDDIKYSTKLISKFIKKEGPENADFLLAARPQIRAVELLLRALDDIGFFFENGKRSTLADGRISNILLEASIRACLPTIEENLKNTDEVYDSEGIISLCEKLYNSNERIIQGREI